MVHHNSSRHHAAGDNPQWPQQGLQTTPVCCMTGTFMQALQFQCNAYILFLPSLISEGKKRKFIQTVVIIIDSYCSLIKKIDA